MSSSQHQPTTQFENSKHQLKFKQSFENKCSKTKRYFKPFQLCSFGLPSFGTYSHFTGQYTLDYETTTYLLSPRSRIFPEKLTVPQPVKKIPSNFIEPEGSLPLSQQPATCPKPEPDQSSLFPPFPTHFLKTHLGETTTPIQTSGAPLSDEAQHPIRTQNWSVSIGLYEGISLITKQSGQSVSNVTPQV